MTPREASPNRAALEAVARRIEPLLPEVVFVGGQMAELLVTAAGARPRATDDVDVVVHATTRSEYRRVEERLRGFGLRNDTRPGAPVCRWLTPEGLVLDVMPVDEEILGFSNRWYAPALETATEFALEGVVIRGVTAPLFLASKWEAFQDRGAGDPFGSHDLEDIIAVVAGRPTVLDEVRHAPPEVRRWIADATSTFLASPFAGYAVEGALPHASRAPGLVDEVMRRLRGLAAG